MKKSSPSSTLVRLPPSDTVIVGNGVIAKTAALALAQAGLQVTMLGPPDLAQEAKAPKSAKPAASAWDVRVYALNHTAFHLLSGLKVWDAMHAERIAPVDEMAIHGDASHANLSFDAFAAHVDALAWIVEDSNLNQALDAALKFAPNLRMLQGRALSLKTEASHASIELDNGETLHASLIIGADGAQSWVRSQCDIGHDYRSYKQQGVVSNFHCERPHRGVARQWFTGSDGIIALLPLPDQQVSLVWSAPENLAQALLAESAGQLAARLAHYCGAEPGELTPLQPELVRGFPLSLIKPHSLIAPRVALVGDAAHVVHPLAGHGMNLGFADIADLVQVISEREPQRDCGDERVLARYARARKEEVLLMQMVTDGLARLFGADFEPLRILRNLGMNLFDKLPLLKQRLIAHALGKYVR